VFFRQFCDVLRRFRYSSRPFLVFLVCSSADVSFRRAPCGHQSETGRRHHNVRPLPPLCFRVPSGVDVGRSRWSLTDSTDRAPQSLHWRRWCVEKRIEPRNLPPSSPYILQSMPGETAGCVVTDHKLNAIKWCYGCCKTFSYVSKYVKAFIKRL